MQHFINKPNSKARTTLVWRVPLGTRHGTSLTGASHLSWRLSRRNIILLKYIFPASHASNIGAVSKHDPINEAKSTTQHEQATPSPRILREVASDAKMATASTPARSRHANQEIDAPYSRPASRNASPQLDRTVRYPS